MVLLSIYFVIELSFPCSVFLPILLIPLVIHQSPFGVLRGKACAVRGTRGANWMTDSPGARQWLLLRRYSVSSAN